MKISARNSLKGIVKSITEGAINNEVIIEVAPGVEIASVITRESCDRLGVVVGGTAYAVIKASNIMVAVD